MTRFDKLRRDYPRPDIALTISDDYGYCVGGALALSRGETCERLRFPDVSTIVALLREVNPCLSYHEATEATFDLVDANDMGNFSDAWALLATALGAYGQEEVGDVPREFYDKKSF